MTTVYKVHNSLKKNGNTTYATVRFKEAYEEPDSPYAMISCRAMQNRGISIRSHWPVNCVLKPDEKRRRPKDASYLSPFLFFSSKAYQETRDLIEPYGESFRAPLLNTDGIEEDWVVYHPMRCLSIVDDPRCKIEWLSREDDRPLFVKKFYFEEKKLEGVPIFLLKEDTSIFATDSFVDRIRCAKLKGLGFRKLWNSELGSIHSEISIRTWGLPEDEDFNW